MAERLRQIAQVDASRAPSAFMKVGDSHTVSKNLLFCFAGPAQPSYVLDLDGRDALLPSIQHFRKGSVGSSTPFDRASLAASVGKSAIWAITGAPSPLEQETAVANPRFAFVGYGSNDMQLGLTYVSAAYPFYENLSELLDRLEQGGIVPLVAGLPPRSDNVTGAMWVPIYDSITRGIAEARQLPYLSMYLAMKDLPKLGLGSDGLHANVYTTGGAAQPCVFTAAGLAFGNNVRNLHSIQQLDVVKRVVLDQAPAPDARVAPPSGAGSPDSPFVIDTFPFTHASGTEAGTKSIDAYPGCASSADESGPERFYQLELKEKTPLRIMLFDRSGVDVDLHLLGADKTGAGCIERDDRIIERTLGPGSYAVVIDSFVSSGKALSGDYLLVVTRCDPADTACQ